MLGSDLSRELEQNGYTVRVFDLPEFDITHADHLARALESCNAVINCAAYTNVDKAEDQPEQAMTVNASAVGELGCLAKERGIHVIHISTDFVFAGDGTLPYSESDATCPLNTYGASKLKGEEALDRSGCRHTIMRVEWSYGRNGVNFITKLLERARTGADLTVVNDQFGAPTWTADMAKAIRCLLKSRSEGLYHFANSGYASRYEVACHIAKELALTNRIAPCSSDAFPVKAIRPRNSRFGTAKIQALLDHPIRPWQTALNEFLHDAR